MGSKKDDRKKAKEKTKKLSFEELEEKRLSLEKFLLEKNVSGVTAVLVGDDPDKPGKDALVVRRSKFAPEITTDLPEAFEGLPVRVGVADYRPRTISSCPNNHIEGFDYPPITSQNNPYFNTYNNQENAPTNRAEIIRAGISVGHPTITAGTLGCFVINKVTQQLGILSNWHVLVGKFGKVGDPVLQPGTIDGGTTPNDKIANLNNWILDNDGDAAVAYLSGHRKVSAKVFGTNIEFTGARMPERDEIVIKSGRTTGVTSGIIKRMGNFTISYDVGPVTIRGFEISPLDENNTSNEEISSGGDSGSVWYSKNSKHAICLHFAGETDPHPESEHAIACQITKVLDRLGCRMAKREEIEQFPVNQSAMERKLSQNLGEIKMLYPIPMPSPTYPPIPYPQPWFNSPQSAGVAAEAYITYLDTLGPAIVSDILNDLRSNGVSAHDLEFLGGRLNIRLSAGWQTQSVIPSSVQHLAPELAPVGWAVIGFASGAAARLAGRERASEALGLGISATAFIVGAIAGSRAVDGRL